MTKGAEPPATKGTADSAATSAISSELEAYVLEAADNERALWVTRCQPARPEDRTNWWLHLLLLVKQRVDDPSQARRQWARLYGWAVEHATDTGAFTADESAITIASFVAELRHRELMPELAGALPSADAIVQACLAQIPLRFAAIPDTSDPRLLDIDTMRQSRRTRNLVSAAAWHRGHVRDPAVATELQCWIETLPRLV